MPFRVAYSWPLCSHVMSSTKPELPILLTIGFSHYLPTSIHTHTHPFNGPFFPGLPGWAGTRKVRPIWISLKQETVSGSGISWAISKSAPRSRQITTPAPDHSVFFTSRMPFLPLNSVTALKANRPNSSHHNTLLAIPRVRRHQTLPPVWRCPLVSHSEQTPALLPSPMPGRGDYGQIWRRPPNRKSRLHNLLQVTGTAGPIHSHGHTHRKFSAKFWSMVVSAIREWTDWQTGVKCSTVSSLLTGTLRSLRLLTISKSVAWELVLSWLSWLAYW